MRLLELQKSHFFIPILFDAENALTETDIDKTVTTFRT